MWEAGARIVLDIIRAPRVDQWMVVSYLAAWLDGRVTFYDQTACDDVVATSAPYCDGAYVITWPVAGAVLAGLAAVAAAAAFVSFRRRDLA
ncbi:MAG TPA: hypothetical protein VNV66_05320 [Pilimelia sp.]|nr:hypothetical protein [Pilimelia sp.]